LKHSWSLVVRLLFSFVGSFIVVALVSNVALYYFLHRGLEASRASILQDRLDAVEALLKSPAHGLEEVQRRVKSEWPLRGGEKVYVQIYDRDHHPVAISPQIPVTLQKRMQSLSSGLQEIDEDSGVSLGRAEVFDNSVGLKGPITVQVAIGQEQGREFLNRFRDLMIVTLILSIAVSFLLGTLIAIQGMKPLREAAVAIGKIDSRNLHERLHLRNPPKELTPLSEAFNQTLDRLEDSFVRLDRFSSDIAHELRTPMTNMMGEIEIALNRPRAEAEYKEILLSLLEECTRLHGIASSLLFLARSENKNKLGSAEWISVSGEISSIVDFFKLEAEEKNIELKIDAATESLIRGENIQIRGQVTLFQRAIANLLSNAIHATAEKGHIVVAVEKTPMSVDISVTDDGVGISQGDLAKIFDRFYRVDPSRNPHSGGFGLGLAIVKSIVDLHQGEVQVASELGRGTRFTLRWPTAPLESSPEPPSLL
jgi:two-component system heavy metal sensor histidine kinase CusS